MSSRSYQLIVIGASSGGIEALTTLIPKLSEMVDLPILIVQHIKANAENLFSKRLDKLSAHHVKEAGDQEGILEKTVYLAPGDYHLLIESNKTLTLSKDDPVCYSRPSIDVLFESAADAFQSQLIAILLTGANRDGANGIAYVHDQGGVTIAQDPEEAHISTMPESAIETGKVDQILLLDQMPHYIQSLLESPSLEGGSL